MDRYFRYVSGADFPSGSLNKQTYLAWGELTSSVSWPESGFLTVPASPDVILTPVCLWAWRWEGAYLNTQNGVALQIKAQWPLLVICHHVSTKAGDICVHLRPLLLLSFHSVTSSTLTKYNEWKTSWFHLISQSFFRAHLLLVWLSDVDEINIIILILFQHWYTLSCQVVLASMWWSTLIDWVLYLLD